MQFDDFSKKLVASLLASALMLPGAGWAAKKVQPQKKEEVQSPPEIIAARPDSLIKSFVYDDKSVYEIRTRSGMFTNISVPPGETIQGFYLSDTVFWKFVVAKDGSRVFVRPSEPGRYNSGTMVTDKRTYELAFRSFDTKEPYWYKRVDWIVENDESFGWGVYADPALAEIEKIPGAKSESVQEEDAVRWDIDVTKANFAYEIEDKKVHFAPATVFDDGRFTYMRFPANTDMPAIFAYDESPDAARLVDYEVIEGSVIIHRVSPGGFILKLGDKSLVIKRKKS